MSFRAVLTLVSIASVISFGTGWAARSASARAEVKDVELTLSGERLRNTNATLRAYELAREVEAMTTDRANLAAELAAERARERDVAEKTVTREVIRYVQSPTAGLLVLPGAWVRLHDIAATDPGAGVPYSGFPAAVAYDAAARITDADSLSVTTENYSTYHDVAGQLIDLQAWVAAECAPMTRGESTGD